MSEILGSVRVTGLIAPSDSTDTYAVTDSIYGRDGLHNYSSVTQMYAISANRRRAGMICGALSGATRMYFKLKEQPWAMTSADWEPITFGGVPSPSSWEATLAAGNVAYNTDAYMSGRTFHFIAPGVANNWGIKNNGGHLRITGNTSYGVFSYNFSRVISATTSMSSSRWELGMDGNGQSVGTFVNSGSGVSKFYLTSAITGTRHFRYPNKSGTFAMLDDISGFTGSQTLDDVLTTGNYANSKQVILSADSRLSFINPNSSWQINQISDEFLIISAVTASSPFPKSYFSFSPNGVFTGFAPTTGYYSFAVKVNTASSGYTSFNAVNTANPNKNLSLFFNSGFTGNRTVYFPNKSGVIAMTSDLTGATGTQTFDQVLTQGSVANNKNITMSGGSRLSWPDWKISQDGTFLSFSATTGSGNGGPGAQMLFSRAGIISSYLENYGLYDFTINNSGITSFVADNLVNTNRKLTLVFNSGFTDNRTILFPDKNGTISLESPQIGDLYGGGIVVSVWKEAGVERGLIASLVDVSSSNWSNISTPIGATAESKSSGETNTAAIVGQIGHTSSAAKLCDDYTNSDTGTGVYSDWYLPAMWELTACYNAAYIVNRILGDTDGFHSVYWSSTETSTNAYYLDFSYGNLSTDLKVAAIKFVRAVRRF